MDNDHIEVIEIKGGWLARAAEPGLAATAATKEEAVAELETALERARVLLDRYTAAQRAQRR
jgi:hypothetical protein